MRRVQFPLVKNGTVIVYPDDIALFSDTYIVGSNIEGVYHGTDLSIPDAPAVVPDMPTRFLPVQDFIDRFNPTTFEGIVGSNSNFAKALVSILQIKTDIDLDDPDTISSLDKIIPSLLSEAEKTILLA